MKIGDIVYYYEHWSDSIIKSEVTEFSGNKQYAKIHCLSVVDIDGDDICKQYGCETRLISDLYSSHHEAYNTYFIKKNKCIKKYCDIIKTIEDLINFPLHHCICGEEYTNNEAKEAYKIRAKELLNIQVK